MSEHRSETVAPPLTRASDPAGFVRWRRAIVAAFALGGITLATWGPRLGQLRADLHVDDGQMGLILGAFTIGSLTGLGLAAPALARLGGRNTIRAVLLVIATGLAVVGLASGVAHQVAPTVLGFVVIGLGIGILDVSVNVQGALVERAAGRTLMPLLHAAWSGGAVLGAGIGAACSAFHVSPTAQFLGEAVAITAVALTLLSAVPDENIPVSADAGRAPARERLRAWAVGWKDLRLLLIGLLLLGVELGEGTANNWLTLAVHDDHHQHDAVAAGFFVAFAAGETLIRVVAGPLVDRVGRVRAVRATTAAGVLGMLLFILATPWWAVLLGTVLWAVGVSMGFPLGMSAAATGPNAAARVSVVATVGYIANLAGPPVIGALAQAWGLLNALWLVLALLVTAFAVCGVLRPATQPG